MKTKPILNLSAALLVLVTLITVPATSQAQGTAFTYQGRLTDNGAAFTGSAEFQATLWGVPVGDTALAANNPVQVIVVVTNGLFVLPLDFGANFSGADRWLQLEVRTVAGPFTTLTPRQSLTATPYAIAAGQLTGVLPAASFSGTYPGTVTLNNSGNSYSGSGAALTSLNASQLTSGIVPDARLSANVSLLGQSIETGEITDGTIVAAAVNPDSFNTTFWRATGNAGTTAGMHFVGTTDNQPLEFRSDNLRVLRLEPNVNSPNLIGGYSDNTVGLGIYGSTIGGGGSLNSSNSIFAFFATISGGRGNTIADGATYSIIAGGTANDIGSSSGSSTIGGGFDNNIAANTVDATIAGGHANDLGTNSDYSTIGGGYNNNIGRDTGAATITGGYLNNIGTNSGYSTIGGGFDNKIEDSSTSATIVGGYSGVIGTHSDYSAISGGYNNTIAANSSAATIAGGKINNIGTNSDYSAIAGGHDNNIANGSTDATITGGAFNVIGTNSPHSLIGGGYGNKIAANSAYGTIPGGFSNTATNYAFAAGYRAKANHLGAFVWGDATPGDMISTVANSVTFRASGGYRLHTGTGAAGAQLAAGATAWAVMSDRNVKKDFAAVDGGEILEKLAAMPITQWHYQWEDASVTPHIGPMAQDFKAAFYPGSDDKSITTLEADGVALAAIQGLNQKVEAKDAEIQELKQRLARLEQSIQRLAR